MDGTKEAIRQRMRRQRRALSRAATCAAGLAAALWARRLPGYGAAPLVVAYAATDNELPTSLLLALALADGKRVFLPRLEAEGMIFAEHAAGAAQRRGRFGIGEPCGEPLALAEVTAGLIFTPLLAWDSTGGRLGRGAGFYDRALAAAPSSLVRVGLGYAFQQCSTLPRDPWDMPLDFVVTEREVLRCRGGDEGFPCRKEDTTRNDIRMDRSDRGSAGRGPDLAGGPSAATAE